MYLDLYAIDASGVQMKDCGGNLQSGMESCVSYAPLPGVTDAYVIGDTKLGDASPTLRFTGDEMRAFINRWTQENGPAA